MSQEVQEAVQRVVAGEILSAETMRGVMGACMDGRAEAAPLAALLTALRMRGERVEELVGAAQAMRERSERTVCQSTELLDTCGTGGDELRTFNISTAAAIVIAACGVVVAKHGNRSVSSSSGSADVLSALGVNIDLPAPAVAECIDEVGIGFCFARRMHPAMKHVAGVRAALGFRTIFNLLGPLTNPARAKYQLLGASRVEIAEKLAHALCQLGTARSIVVCGADMLDEVSLWGETTVFQVENDDVKRVTWNAATFGLQQCGVDELRVSSAEESAGRIREILAGTRNACREIVIANAAAGLVAAGVEADPLRGAERVARAIDSGAATEKLRRLVEASQRLGSNPT